MTVILTSRNFNDCKTLKKKPNPGNLIFRQLLPRFHHGIYTPADVRNELMISNERPSPFNYRPQMQPRLPVHEDTLKSAEVQIERKTFVLTLKENPPET
jgi:hypothetical protein